MRAPGGELPPHPALPRRWPWEVSGGFGLGLVVFLTSWSWAGAVVAGPAVAVGLAGLATARNPLSRGLALGVLAGGAAYFVALLLLPFD